MKKLTPLLALVLVLITCSNVCFAQTRSAETKVGISYSRFVTGSGARMLAMPSVVFNKGEYFISISPGVDKSGIDLTGLNYEFKFTPTLQDPTLDLFFHYTGILNSSISMNYTDAMIMEKVPVELVDGNELSSFEHYGGFGIGKSFLKKFSWQTSIGFGFYKVNINRDIQYINPSLILKATITYL